MRGAQNVTITDNYLAGGRGRKALVSPSALTTTLKSSYPHMGDEYGVSKYIWCVGYQILLLQLH